MIRAINTIINQCTKLPFPHANQEKFTANHIGEYIRIIKKYLWRKIITIILKQNEIAISRAPTNCKVLFVYHGVTNFGDALMDLSGRFLLKNKVKIDLLAPGPIAEIFLNDDVFGKIYTDPSEIKKGEHNFILLNNLGIRAIKYKHKYFKEIPYACTIGQLTHIDYNHIELSYSAINSIFNIGLSKKELEDISKPYLKKSFSNIASNEFKNKDFVIISLGGRDPRRTYAHWNDVVSILDSNESFSKQYEIIFIGSNNAIKQVEEIQQKKWKNIKFKSMIGKFKFEENKIILDEGKLFIGADGGLMHLAHTSKIRSVTLFDSDVQPAMRLTKPCNSKSIKSSGEVSLISPALICENIFESLNINV